MLDKIDKEKGETPYAVLFKISSAENHCRSLRLSSSPFSKIGRSEGTYIRTVCTFCTCLSACLFVWPGGCARPISYQPSAASSHFAFCGL